MNWPKEWIEAVFVHTKAIHDYQSELDDIRGKVCENILNELSKIGALKEPPKPREFWICEYECQLRADQSPKLWHGATNISCPNRPGISHKFIHVREVIEDEK